MNAETQNLIERPYQEIVDDILTAIVGGVVNEPIFFDVKEDLYPLAQPASDIRGITGTRSVVVNGTRKLIHHTFQKEVDFLFDEGRNAVAWQQGGQKPEDETIFYADYFRPNGRSPLSDINVGSVTRTLSEAIGREIATVYEQINRAYLSGFVDTATGQALDLVVAILVLKRKTKDFALGLVTFFRDPTAGDGNITIPEGVLLTTAKGTATFITAQMRTLQRGQVRIDVPVRASDASKGPAGIVKAGEITTLAQPITGIARVTNLEATVLGTEDENDEDLRKRAKAALHGLGKATPLALAQVIAEERATLIEAWDPNGPPIKQSPAGTVTLLVKSEPERFATLNARVQETRAAGVLATLVARYVFFKPRLVVKIASGLTPAGKIKLVDQIIEAMQGFVDKLGAGDPVKGQELIGAIVKEVKEVGSAQNITVKDVMTWRSDISRPGAEELADTLMSAITAAIAGDPAALHAAIVDILTSTAPAVPTSQRIPDRSLLRGLTQQSVTDTMIETGAFEVVPVDQDWWVVLDAERADVLLVEQ